MTNKRNMTVGLVYPTRARWPKMAWVEDAAAALGHQVVRVTDVDSLQRADEVCQIIVFEHKSAGLNPNEVSEIAPGRRAVWVQWWFDLVTVEPDKPLAQQSYVRSLAKMMRAMDHVLVKEADSLNEYRRLGINATWFDQGCPSWLPVCEHRERPDWDVLVVGSNRSGDRARRADVSSLVAAGFRVAWAGRGRRIPNDVDALPECPARELPRLVGRAAVLLGVDARHDVAGYWSDRLWLALGMGACHLRRATPGMPRLPCFLYGSHEQLIHEVQRLGANAELRRETGRQARDVVMKNHTYEHRIQEVLKRCTSRRERNVPAAAAAGSWP